MAASNDGSESVDQFLARIASLNTNQGLEEAERSRKMEEEMLQARKERQARRAGMLVNKDTSRDVLANLTLTERARSLSPAKTGPAPSLRHIGEETPKHSQGIEPPVALTPPLHSRTLGRSGSISPRPGRPAVPDLDFSQPLPPPPLDDKPSMPSPPPTATALSRSGTLSWNQRPSPRAGGSIRSRPQSVASVADTSAIFGTSPQKSAEEVSKKDIAASLGAKDPSWFRQTADRGTGSAAYRKNESEAETPAFASRRMKLPGLSKDPTSAHEDEKVEMERPIPSTPPTKHVPSSTSDQKRTSAFESQARPTRPVSLVSETPSKSPALDLPSFKPLDLNLTLDSDAIGLGRTASILSSAGRPSSPTKGLGGFVQSAMMKRSDSVNKRWSVQANAGLKRGDSVATTRPPHLSGTSEFSPGHSRNSSKDTRGIRDGYSSPLSASRPVSSHGAEPVPIARGRPFSQAHDEPAPSPQAQTDVEHHDRAERTESLDKEQIMRTTTPPLEESPLARSPSKTMDPRRWSPTKASWLESALNKPDSPRFTPAKVQTPAWRLNMQRSKIEEEARSSGIGAVSNANPVVASNPVSSTPLASPRPKEGKPLQSDSTKLPTGKAALQGAASEPAFAEPDASTRAKKEAVSKKEEKPTIPSKRNITPARLDPISNGKTQDEATSAASEPKATEHHEKEHTAGDQSLMSEIKPPIAKAKPETPPKTDFRANLKPRQAPRATSNDTEPEFKAVFGKLKRASTQQYKAPDVLKDNITKGKSALNVTGGPQKVAHVDEFKQSILQKKEAMKASPAATSKRPESTDSKAKPAGPVPEALARRMTLHRATPSSEKAEPKKLFDTPANSGTFALGSKTQPEKLVTERKDSPLPSACHALQTEKPSSADLNKTDPTPATSAPNKPGTTSLKAAVGSISGFTIKEPVSSPIVEPSATAKVTESSKIAARLNPALADLLSRTAGPKLPGGPPPTERGQMRLRDDQQSSRQETSEESAELTHMTKARAKGPKRRAPKSSATQPPSEKEIMRTATDKTDVVSDKPLMPSKPLPETRSAISEDLRLRPLRGAATWADTGTNAEEKTDKKPAATSLGSQESPMTHKQQAQQVKLVERPIAGQTTKSEPLQESKSSIRAKPPVANKSTELRKVSSTIGYSKPTEKTAPAKPSTPKRFDVLTDRLVPASSPPAAEGGSDALSDSPPMLSTALPLTPSKSKLNTPKPRKPSLDVPTKSASTTAASKASGLGLKFDCPSRRPATVPELTPPPEREVAAARGAVSPTKTNFSLRPQIESFFGAVPRASERAEFDTQGFLSSQHGSVEKMKTMSYQIWEVTGDGKRSAMPPQQEHILFEDCMYLCVHSMQASNGSRLVEVYLWCGDEVPAAAIEDAQLFCRKVARDNNNSKLQVIRQGKESSEFFQALGGIVIVRRNKSSAIYMLCGRRHLGHVAFDEVDYSPSSLCSGLPFLISAKFGKLYLWKGHGSDPEDVGCARLIGMDLGLTGEIEEILEGVEPAGFWESFHSRPPKGSETQGHKDARQFRGRSSKLYRVEHDRPKSSGGFWGLRSSSPPKQSPKALLEEITPFTQKDLDANHIHILDTYGELYVYVHLFENSIYIDTNIVGPLGSSVLPPKNQPNL